MAKLNSNILLEIRRKQIIILDLKWYVELPEEKAKNKPVECWMTKLVWILHDDDCVAILGLAKRTDFFFSLSLYF